MLEIKNLAGKNTQLILAKTKERYEGKVCLGSKLLGSARRVNHQKKSLVWTTGGSGFWLGGWGGREHRDK